MLKLLLVVMMATLTAGFGFVAWLSLRPPPPPVEVEAPAPPPPAKLGLLAAARPIGAGTLLKPDDLVAVAVAAEVVPLGARIDTPENRSDLVGAMVLRSLSSQQVLLPPDLLRPRDGGFLAAVLGPNYRAVAVAVDAVSGTAGLIWPGDRVDMILTQALDDQGTPAGRRTFGETVLKDLRVIAVDQQLAHVAGPENTSGNRTVTLAVLPDEAERVAVAVRLGKVALTVRPAMVADTLEQPVSKLADGGAKSTTNRAARDAPPSPAAAPTRPVSTTWGQDVSPGLMQRPAVTAPTTVRVYQGTTTDKEFKFE